MDNKTRRRIISALRRISQWADQNKETRSRARLMRGHYQCELCTKVVNKVQIDHKQPVVSTLGFSTWDEYIARLFCGADNLWALCQKCHDEKTSRERIARRKV